MKLSELKFVPVGVNTNKVPEKYDSEYDDYDENKDYFYFSRYEFDMSGLNKLLDYQFIEKEDFKIDDVLEWIQDEYDPDESYGQIYTESVNGTNLKSYIEKVEFDEKAGLFDDDIISGTYIIISDKPIKDFVKSYSIPDLEFVRDDIAREYSEDVETVRDLEIERRRPS